MTKNTYASAGVDINNGNQLVSNIKSLAKRTHRNEVMSTIGSFGSLFSIDTQKYKEPVMVSGTDGVGTKLMIAHKTGKHDTIGIDLVAMCANDILCHGAEPLFFLDYFATGKLEVNAAVEVIAGIAQGCKEANMALIGGETAEMPGMYSAGEYDLAGFALGIVEKESILPKGNIKAGDILLGCNSSGLHSNGFSLVRKILADLKIDVHDQSPWQNKSWGEILLEPTALYVKPVLATLDKIKGLAHITGGGMSENIPRILPDELTFTLDYHDWPEIFQWLQKEGNIDTDEMLKVFNCGIGMTLVVSPEDVSSTIEILEKHSVYANKIGEIVSNIY